jgi:hypothetical protein
VRRSLTRAYRRAVERRIESLFKSNPSARMNAPEALDASDIDHILDLQLMGRNTRSNLKTLHSATNQGLGRQISRQLPVGVKVPVIGLEVIE